MQGGTKKSSGALGWLFRGQNGLAGYTGEEDCTSIAVAGMPWENEEPRGASNSKIL